MKQQVINQKIIKASKYSLFWSWNLIFGLVIGFVLFEHMIIPVVTGTVTGSVPLDQGAFALALVLVPLACVILALTKGFRFQPDRLLQLFYGVEIPLFFLILIRLTLLRELNSGTLHLLVVFIVGMSVFAWYMFKEATDLCRSNAAVSLTGLSFTLLAAAYVALLLLFFTFPLMAIFLKGFFSFSWLAIFKGNLLSLLIVVFAAYTATVFVGLPVMMSYLFLRTFVRQFKLLSRPLGVWASAGLVGVVVLANLAVFHDANVQNQHQALTLLQQPIDNEQDRQRLIDKSDVIRDGLLNIYLASYRYTSSARTVNALQELYAHAFGLERDGFPRVMQSLFNTVAKPFLYEGEFSIEAKQKAAEKYAEFFDTPIEKAERQAIQRAIKANWSREGMAAGLIDKDSEKVLITRQLITVQEQAHWAVITLDESYENQTFTPQEIIYHFSLPQDAVVTGVWLSEVADNPTMYPYTVAPRGAAQKVYRQELQQRQDPALLEQVGPRQYRLRAFPIPARRTGKRHSLEVDVQQLHLRLQYVAPLNKSARWLLPQLLEKRNLYWKNNLNWHINGKPLSRKQGRWLPSGIDAQKATPLTQQQLHLDTPNGSVKVEVKPLGYLATPLVPQSYAVLIDTSYSMRQHKQALNNAIKEMRKLAANSSVAVEFFQTGSSPKRLPDDFNVDDLVFFGNTGHLYHLQQWRNMSNPETYDVVFLLTDQGSYEIEESAEAILPPTQPIWLVHLQNSLPYAYDDRLLELLNKSDGGIATSIENALQHSLWRQSKQSSHFQVVSDNYLWSFTPLDKLEVVDATKSAPALYQLAAYQWIKLGHRLYHQEELATLDQLHKVAVDYSLVSPFSSMIVFVNNQQKQDLDNFSAENDRFERIIESGGKNVSTPMDMLTVKGVPEPEEWALMIVVITLLISAYVRKQGLLRFDYANEIHIS